jgi:hypothetical protein
MCVLKDCNVPCPWDDNYKKWWKYCTPAHNQKAREEHVAFPATIITVDDPAMPADRILAGTSAYITPLVPPSTGAPEDLVAKADELAQSLFDDDELLGINWRNSDDVEGLGNVNLVATFEQVSDRKMSATDENNIAQAWQPGLMSAKNIAEIYTGTQPQEIAWLYNALTAEVRAHCSRMQQENASQTEIKCILEKDKIKMRQDLATETEIRLIAEEDKIECQVYGVLCEMIEQIMTQVAPDEEKSHEAVVRVQTYAEQAWEALKAELERKKKAAEAHAAMLRTH